MVIRIVLVVLGAVVLFFGVVMAASEFGTEVVVLHTTDESGGEHATSLWIVEDEGALWLRSGMQSGWLDRLQARPDVELERAGQRVPMRAVAVPERRDRIHELMAERYGWAETIVAAARDGSGSVPVRLDPR